MHRYCPDCRKAATHFDEHYCMACARPLQPAGDCPSCQKPISYATLARALQFGTAYCGIRDCRAPYQIPDDVGSDLWKVAR